MPKKIQRASNKEQVKMRSEHMYNVLVRSKPRYRSTDASQKNEEILELRMKLRAKKQRLLDDEKKVETLKASIDAAKADVEQIELELSSLGPIMQPELPDEMITWEIKNPMKNDFDKFVNRHMEVNFKPEVINIRVVEIRNNKELEDSKKGLNYGKSQGWDGFVRELKAYGARVPPEVERKVVDTFAVTSSSKNVIQYGPWYFATREAVAALLRRYKPGWLETVRLGP